MSILTRSQNSTFSGSRDERGTRINIGWFAIKGAETCLPSGRVCWTFLIGPTGHKAFNGFPRVAYGTEFVFSVDNQFYAPVPDIGFHEFLRWRLERSARKSVPGRESSRAYEQKRSAA
ncbi:hypothetical protein J2W42_002231 [Rhizobium tibeticum]|nr:hypothetical protein [Rhizobium tibeticum]